jgi:D-beta-D-heptose 7-phosphate kinase/D-beta-D-heptose 1-phosphate adenosyltransferase
MRNPKILALKDLLEVRARLRREGKTVVFTNGCFDLIHGGHIGLFRRAKKRGDVLIVAVNSDASVRQVKGEGRPIIGENQRLRILAALEVVDYVTLFASPQLPEILQRLKPDILTKGSNYPEEAVAGREVVQSYGGQVRLVPITEPVSVSQLIHRIRQGEGGG